MTTTTNIHGSDHIRVRADIESGRENNMKSSKFLAPQLSNQTITKLIFGYLTIVIAVLIITVSPFQSATSLNLGAQPVSASMPTVVVEVPSVQIPAAPYIIVGRAD
tara:strand:- start:303 stop:620 length:318 start_codon:yes stop_codon:yes gene_type:complete